MGEDQRNLFIALGLILVILTGYQMFVMGPAEEERRAEQAAVEASQELRPPLIARRPWAAISGSRSMPRPCSVHCH
jgi:hypothetical protein